MRIIAGEARGRRIEAPAGRDTRPTLDRVRENLFNMLQGEIEGRKILDLFAGSGALSFEALSRGAESACLADHDRKAIAAERRNAEALGYQDRIRIFPTDWRKALKELEKDGACFDIVFLDPPYAMLALGEVFSELRSVIDRDTLIILEHEAGKTPETGEGFVRVKQRSWGFCGVTIYRMEENGEGGERL
jgi:16S rRNA (guanine(966)-N(2))-methyltransferase RsmD